MKKHKSGFTLIEIIIYVALFSILLSVAYMAAFQLIGNSNRLNSSNSSQEEGNFVLRKINWALTGVDPLSSPVISGTGCSQSLSVIKTDPTINQVTIRLSTVNGKQYIELQKNGGSFYFLTTDNVSVTCLKFSLINSLPIGISSTTTINGLDFNLIKYLRK